MREPRRFIHAVAGPRQVGKTTLARDVLLLSRVDKPAVLRRLFELACRYSGQVLSYTKMLGQLQDAGNVTTLAHATAKWISSSGRGATSRPSR